MLDLSCADEESRVKMECGKSLYVFSYAVLGHGNDDAIIDRYVVCLGVAALHRVD